MSCTLFSGSPCICSTLFKREGEKTNSTDRRRSSPQWHEKNQSKIISGNSGLGIDRDRCQGATPPDLPVQRGVSGQSCKDNMTRSTTQMLAWARLASLIPKHSLATRGTSWHPMKSCLSFLHWDVLYLKILYQNPNRAAK